jgi:hypothetical protein
MNFLLYIYRSLMLIYEYWKTHDEYLMKLRKYGYNEEL